MKGKTKNAPSTVKCLGPERYRNAAAQAILNYMLSSDRSSATLQKYIAEMLGYRVLAGDYEPVDRNGVQELPSLPDDVTDATIVQHLELIHQERTKMLAALRSALERDDQDAALAAARQLAGLSPKGREAQ